MKKQNVDEFDQDGFKIVKSKRNKNGREALKLATKTNLDSAVDKETIDTELVLSLEKKIRDLKSKLENNDNELYWSKFRLILKSILNNFFQVNYNDNNNNTKSEIYLVCYGLGSLEDNFLSRYQLALFLLLIDELKCMNVEIKLVELFDPVFTQADKYLLTNTFEFSIPDENVKCMRKVKALIREEDESSVKAAVLFYMPHCGRPLYNNLLYSNWSKSALSKLILLGNSFATIETNTLSKRNYMFILDGLSLCDENKLEFECELTNAFKDLSFHWFKRNKLNDGVLVNMLANKFDKALDEPIYNENDEIF